MEIFGMFVPLWVIVTTYIVGMFVIGYPMGYYSLKAWKYYPESYSLGRKLLFPIASKNKKITSIDDASDFTGGFRLNKALEHNDKFVLMRYIFTTMLLWPVRFSYLSCILLWTLTWNILHFCLTKIVYPFLLFVGWIANTITTLGAKGLLVCKKCEI